LPEISSDTPKNTHYENENPHAHNEDYLT
jgi:hypothetical protein